MGLIGRVVGLVGCITFIGGMFANYVGEPVSAYAGSLWQVATRVDIVVFVAALAVAALLVVGFFAAPRTLAAIAAGLAGAAFGFVTPVEASTLSAFGPGMWLTAIGALVMFVGAALAASAGGYESRGQGVRATAEWVPAGPPSPPPGWYTDPAGGQGQRYWSGQAWSHETRA